MEFPQNFEQMVNPNQETAVPQVPQNIILDAKLRTAIKDYINFRGYAIWTKDKYNYYIDKLFSEHKSLNKKTCRKIAGSANPNQRAVLNLIYKSASHSDIEIPTITVTKKLKPASRKLPDRRYTIQDIKNIIDYLDDPMEKLFFRCCYSIGAGLRVSEVIKLKWRDFLWNGWILTPDNQGEVEIKATKRGKSSTPPVPSELMKSLYNYARENRVQMNMEYMGEGIGFRKVPTKDDFVFKFPIHDFDKDNYLKNVDKKRWEHQFIRSTYNYVNYNIIIQKISKYLGHTLKVHALRHTRALQLLNSGVELSKVSKLLNHTDISTTMIYLDMTSLDLAKAIKDIPSI